MEAAKLNKPMFTGRELVSLSVPIILDSVLGIMAGMADAAMVSSAGEAAVSGVALVDQLFILLVMVFSAIASGGVVITGQYIGNQNFKKAKTSANQLLYAVTAVALAITLAAICFIPQILRLVYGEVEADVMENAKAYFFYALLGLPFLAIGSSGAALLRTMSHSKLALTLTGGVNVVNIIGNAVLIYGCKLGAAGAAMATSFSRLVWAIVSLVILHNKALPVYFENLLRFRIDWDIMKKILRIGVANGLENSSFHIGKLLVASLIASFGTVFIAANYVASTLCNVGWTIVGSLGTVMLTVVSQCIGADEQQQAKRYTRKFLMLSHIFVFTLFGSVFLLRNQLVQLFDFEADSLKVAAYYTGLGALCTIFAFYGSAFVPVAAFRAAGDVRYAMILTIASMFTFRVALSFLLNHFFALGLLSVWIGMWADWFFRAIMNTIRFRSGKWLRKKLV